MSTEIELLERVISENLPSIHTIADIAKLVSASPETLRKDFVRLTGKSLSDFVRNCRIEQAKNLLTNSNLTCRDVCKAVGFSREDVGAHVFKRNTGLTMDQFRNLPSDRVQNGGQVLFCV